MYSIIVHIVNFNEQDHVNFMAVRFQKYEVANLMTLCFYENKFYCRGSCAANCQYLKRSGLYMKIDQFANSQQSYSEMFKLYLV